MTKRRWTILLGAILIGAGVLWLLLGREPIQEGRCRLVRKKADPDSQLVALAFQFLQPLDGRPDALQDAPVGFEHPRYYALDSGDRRVLMAADFSQKLVRLCVDTDGDGVLSKGRYFTAQISKATPVSGGRQQFGPLSFLSDHPSTKADGTFLVNCYREDARGLLILRPAFVRTGRIRLDGQTYRVAVVDGDCDGAYGSILSLPLGHPYRIPGCDVFAIDLNQNGTFEYSLRGPPEVMPLGRLVRVADAYYAIDIALDGSNLALSRIEPELGTLFIEPNDVSIDLKLWSDAAGQYLWQGGTWQLPTGTYKAVNLTLETMDVSGDLWMFSVATNRAESHLGALDFFAIEPGQATTIRIGSPFVVRADVEKTAPGVVSIAAVLVGCGGEEYDIGIRRNRKPLPEPAFRVVNEEGTVLVDDRFQYG